MQPTYEENETDFIAVGYQTALGCSPFTRDKLIDKPEDSVVSQPGESRNGIREDLKRVFQQYNQQIKRELEGGKREEEIKI